jgi:DNA topoisomerase I
VKMGAVFGSLDRDDDVLALGLNRAVDLLAKKMASVRTIGPHPGDKELVTVRKGRFGPYVQHGKTVANLPRGVGMEDVALDDAVALLAQKGKALKPRGAGRRKGKAPARQTAGETAAKEPVRKAAAVRKSATNPASAKKAAAIPTSRQKAATTPTSPNKAGAKKGAAKKAPRKAPRKAAPKVPRRAAE